MFKLAMIQMRVEGGRKQANISRALLRIAEAAENGAQVLILPESLNLGWTWPASKNESDETGADVLPNGATCRKLADAAKRHRVYICAGLIELSKDTIYNSAVLIDPQGEVLLLHRKLNELQIAHQNYGQGDRLGVAHTPFGTLGLMVCADGFAVDQVITRTLGYMGAQVILSPSAWAVPADHNNQKQPYGQLWRDNFGPPARDFKMWIAGVSNVGPVSAGPWTGRKCIGCSLLVGPDGKQVVQGSYGEDAEQILYHDVEPVERPTRGDGWAEYWLNSKQ